MIICHHLNLNKPIKMQTTLMMIVKVYLLKDTMMIALEKQ